MSARPYHRRYHSDAIAGYMGLTLEERGAYSTWLDYLYDRRAPLPGNIRLLAGYLDVSVRRAQAVLDSLLLKGKLYRREDGSISNRRFDNELEKDARTADHMAEIGKNGGLKSVEVRKKTKENKASAKRAVNRPSTYPYPDSIVQSNTGGESITSSDRPTSLLPSQATADAKGSSRKKRSDVPVEFPHQEAKDAAVKFWRDRGRTDLIAEIEDEAAKFRDHFIGHGKPMVNWPATWRNWVRNALKMNRPPRGWVPPPAATPVSDVEQWVVRLELFHHGEEVASIDKGYWRDEWGPPPGRPGCQVPGAAMKEYAARHRPKVATG